MQLPVVFRIKSIFLIIGFVVGMFVERFMHSGKAIAESYLLVEEAKEERSVLLSYDVGRGQKIEDSSALPTGFVYLKDIDPTIQQFPRYEMAENFLGRQIDGYRKGVGIVLSCQAAKALKKAQERVAQDGYELVVYDGYRPQIAVDDFIRWAEDEADQSKKEEYFPRVDKKDLFRLGYIAQRSRHSRGSTVDLTLIKKGEECHKPFGVEVVLADGSIIKRLDDGTLDMGTSFDFFDVASWGKSLLVSKEAQKNRNYLANVMKENGFEDLPEEWWYFVLKDEPFPRTYFDFSF